jgi:glucoamylase
MSGTPEQAVIGNSQMLATIGKHGELRYLFWPTVDYPQHVLGSLPGLFYSRKKGSNFGWLTDLPWEQKQEYAGDTNILLTVFKNSEAGLNVTATDFVLPDVDVLVRHFSFQNVGTEDIFVRFFYYNDLAIAESSIDDAAYYEEQHDVLIHYKRDFDFLYGGTSHSSGHQCGVHGEPSDAFYDAYDATLSSDSLVLYDSTRAVNSCLSWDLGTLRSGEAKELTVFIVMGSNEEEVLRILKENRQTKFELLVKRTDDFWGSWLNSFRHSFESERLNRMVRRSLLVLKLLTDRNHGGIVAAPCMDPEYRFCWPRDATYVAYALDRCGFHEEAKRFYKWCKRAQEKEGGLYQRYYIEAKIRGPCWSSQIDEIATVIWGVGKHFDLTNDHGFIKSMWSSIKKAAEFLCAAINPTTNLTESVGLWEEKFGSHTYSNAAIYSALKTSARIATFMDEDKLSEKWNAEAEKIRDALLNLIWDSQRNRFIKTFNPKDEGLDVSLLGLTVPFEVLPAQDERMQKTALAIEQSFNFEVGGIGRYPGDLYYHGNPWILTTLWLALYYEQLGDISKAEKIVTWVIEHATDLDLLAEQVDKSTGLPISAIPLAWSHAFFILAVLGLEELKARRT